MLVLSRKSGESIQIGQVRLTVVRIQGRQVRLGIAAPSEIVIRRTELAEDLDSPVSQIPPHTPGDGSIVEVSP